MIAIGAIAALPVFMVVLLLGRSIVLQLMGYPVDIPPSELVEEIAARNDDPLRCRKLQQTVPSMGPSLAEKRMLCFFLLATQKNEPKICEFLMPSEYGMSCIGEIWGKLIDESNCHWYKDNAVRCFEGKSLTPHIYDCQEKSVALLPNECKHRIAFRDKKEDLCDAIEEPILRSICKVRIKTWKQYPILRSTIYFKENIE